MPENKYFLHLSYLMLSRHIRSGHLCLCPTAENSELFKFFKILFKYCSSPISYILFPKLLLDILHLLSQHLCHIHIWYIFVSLSMSLCHSVLHSWQLSIQGSKSLILVNYVHVLLCYTLIFLAQWYFSFLKCIIGFYTCLFLFYFCLLISCFWVSYFYIYHFEHP